LIDDIKHLIDIFDIIILSTIFNLFNKYTLNI